MEDAGESLNQSIGDIFRLGSGRCLNQNNELISAEPSDEVAWSHGPGQQRRNVKQHAVARRVTEAVVDFLKTVEINEDYGDPKLIDRGLIDSISKRQPHASTVSQAGKVIASCGRYRLFAFDLSGDVSLRAHHVGHLPGLVTQRNECDFIPKW